MASKYAGIVQDELRDLRGNAMQGAVVIVRELGTTTPATVYNNPVLIAEAAGGDALVNDGTTGLPAASGLLQPGIDANGNYTFYADADVSYDLRVLWHGLTFDYRVRPKVVDEAYTSTADLTAALAGTFVGPAAAVAGAATSTVVGSLKVTGDANDRLRFLANGSLRWVNPASGATYATLALGSGGAPEIDGSLRLRRDTDVAVAPEVQFFGNRGKWLIGQDVANNGGGGRDFVSVARINNDDSVSDVMYWNGRDGVLEPTCGFGITPPDARYRVQITGAASENTMGCLGVRVGPTQTGRPFALYDSTPVDRLWVDKDFVLSGLNAGFGGALVIKADVTNDRAVSFVSADGTKNFGWNYLGGYLQLRSYTGGLTFMQFDTAGNVYTSGPSIHQSTTLLQSTTSVGVAAVDATARLVVGADDATVAQQTLRLRVGAAQTGKALVVYSATGPTERLWVDSGFFLSGSHGNGGAIVIKSDAANERPLSVVKSDGTVSYGLQYSSSSLQFRNISGGVTVWQADTNGTLQVPLLRHTGATLGFYGAAAVAKPTGVAVDAAGIHAALVTLGLIAA